MNTLLLRLIPIPISVILICYSYKHKSYRSSKHDFSILQQVSQPQKSTQQPVSKNTISHTITTKQVSDSTFTLKIENEKRVVDDALKAKLSREIKAAIANNHLKKPYKIAMGFTKGARDVETFLFGEQIFYTLAESGFSVKGTPLDMPDEITNPIPRIKVSNGIIYVILSKM